MINIFSKVSSQSMFRSLVTIILNCALLSHAKTEVPVFLLSGQSNMTGYAAVSDLTADQKRNVDNVKIYMDLDWEGDDSKERKWLTLGTGFGSNGNNLGPELFIGRTLSDSLPGQKIALVKDCVGSTYLGKSSDWLPPSSNNGNGGTLYKNMMNNTVTTAIRTFTQAFDTSQYTPKWAGFVWLQGEFDAQNQSYSNAYENNLTNLINDIRAQLNIPDLPVIIPMIDQQNQWTYNSIVRAAEIAVTKNLKNVDTLDTRGFATDGTHYKGQGQVKVGMITAQRWLNMHYNYGSAVPVVFFPNSSSERSQLVRTSTAAFFDLSGKKVSDLENGVSRSLPGNGIFITTANGRGEMLGEKRITVGK